MRQPTYAQVSALAYKLYEEDGRPEGEAESHWHRALDILTHPENYSDENVLSPPSEPELTRALDAKTLPVDVGIPSDPYSARDAYHQHIEVGIEGRKDRAVAKIKEALRSLKGVEQVEAGKKPRTVRISFDARHTNPAAILESLSGNAAATV